MTEYIEREAALNASKIVYIEYIEIDGDGYEDGNADEIPVVFKRDIEAIPAADVVPVRHGRWISDIHGKRFGTAVRLDENGSPVETCHCSECGEWLIASDEYPVIGYYCPNCGAKMDEETKPTA